MMSSELFVTGIIFAYLSRKTTLLKKFIKISYVILAAFLGLLMLLYLTFSSYTVQNFVIGKVAGYVNETYKTRISIGEISYDGWSFFSLRRVCFGDQKADTTFYAGRLQFNLAGLNIDSTRFSLSDVVLDEGLCKITTYKDGTYSMDVINNFNDPTDTLPHPPSPPFVLEFRNLECMDSRFMLIDSTSSFEKEGFDPAYIHFYEASFRSRHFKIIDDSLVFDIRNFSCKERSGFEVLRMKAQATIASRIIEMKDLDMVTPNSHFRNYFSMNSPHGWDDYGDFLNKVVLKGRLVSSEVDMKDVVCFAPQLKDYKYKATISGEASGPISRINAKKISAFMGADTRFSGSLRLDGLPNIDETFIEAEADYASTSKAELEKIIGMELPSVLTNFGKMVYKGRFTGFYTDFVTYGNLETAYGNGETDLNMKLGEDVMKSEYSGFIKLKNFNLGAIAGSSSLGFVSLDAGIQGKGLDLQNVNSHFNSTISEIEYNGYKYKDISLDGSLIKKDLKTQLDINDTNLEVVSRIHVDLSNEFSHIDAEGSIINANVRPLNLLNNSVSLGTDFEIDFHFKNLDQNYGNIRIENMHYEKAGYVYRIHQLELESETGEHESLRLNGDFIHGSVNGQFNPATLFDLVSYWTLNLGKSYFNPVQPVFSSVQKFNFNVNLLTTSTLSPLLFPGINATNVELEGMVDGKSESYEIAGHIGNFNANGYILNQTTFKAGVQSKSSGELLFGFNSFGKADTLYAGDFAMKIDALPDKWDLQYQINDSQSLVTGEFKHSVSFDKDKVMIDYLPSWVGSRRSFWNVAEGKTVEINSENIRFNGFELDNGDQKLTLEGYYAFNGQSKNISCKLHDFNLNTINQFIHNLGVEAGGLANGYVVYKNFGDRDVIISQLSTKDLSLDNDTLGDYDFGIAYKEQGEDLIIDLKSDKGKIRNLKANGVYDIATRYLRLNCQFKESEITSFQAFVKDYVKLNQGKATLNGLLEGEIDDLKLNGSLMLSEVDFVVEYLQSRYKFENARVNFDDRIFKIIPFDLKDEKGAVARVSGTVSHKGFTDLTYDIKAENFKNMMVLNTTEKDNELFYGVAYASGNFELKGNTKDVAMYIKATSEKNTKIVINPFGTSTETGESYLHYVSYDTAQTYRVKGKSSNFGIGVYMDIIATPNAEVQVIFDAQSDDKIRAKGNAKLRMEYLPNGNFNMFGNYDLTEGEYRFSTMNVVAKKFDLKRGSNIVWTGDPLTGRLDITGVYGLKTRVNTIVNMSNASDPNVKVPVECIINIKGIVEKPEVSFDLNFPDLQNNLTGTAASELSAVLNNFRKEPELMNQQLLFLLISGSFVPINNSNSANSNNLGNQTLSDLFSKQAAGLLGKAIPNWDVNVDVLTASDPSKGRTFLISASKQFLDNRLELQTSYAVDNTQSNFSLTYNLRKSGSSKVKIFNKSGFDAIYNRNVITSGVGLYYRREFDDLSELLHGSKRKNR